MRLASKKTDAGQPEHGREVHRVTRQERRNLDRHWHLASADTFWTLHRATHRRWRTVPQVVLTFASPVLYYSRTASLASAHLASKITGANSRRRTVLPFISGKNSRLFEATFQAGPNDPAGAAQCLALDDITQKVKPSDDCKGQYVRPCRSTSSRHVLPQTLQD